MKYDGDDENTKWQIAEYNVWRWRILYRRRDVACNVSTTCNVSTAYGTTTDTIRSDTKQNETTITIETMDKFRNKYRIPSARLQHWDYRWAGAYFITICTQHRIHYFGEIENQKMILSHVGILADVFWHEIQNHAQNVELGEFVVMPNHIHGILILTVETLHATSLRHATSLHGSQRDPQRDSQSQSHKPKNEQMANISPKLGSVSAIIRGYKSAVTKHAHRLGFEFEWQSRFHDHIIRNDASFQKITNYIINNPAHWPDDKLFNQ